MPPLLHLQVLAKFNLAYDLTHTTILIGDTHFCIVLCSVMEQDDTLEHCFGGRVWKLQ